MDELMSRIDILACEELDRANGLWPNFHSPHEAYGVLKEEVEEAKFDMDCVVSYLDNVWKSIKLNSMSGEELEALRNYAIMCAAECVQVVAMCQKACAHLG